jgi:hypothetical protein
MPEETPQTNGHTENPLVHYEHTDASFPWIRGFVIGGIVVGVIIFVGVWLFLEGYKAHEDRARKSPFPLAPKPSKSLPKAPQLEQLDRLAGIDRPNVYKREAAKLSVLDSYDWNFPTTLLGLSAGGNPFDIAAVVGTRNGFTHIPIKHAMELLAEDKQFRETWLPSRPELSADQRKRSEGLVDAGEPNSGRMFRGGEK